ncbi:MAG TPA: Hsp20/alpha crystallin family protein [Solirubrobacteraceae bacterium]|nr:Hsp20/alpha crystallin family protein [Solirubrobacteraceae bacterium]
MALIRWEPVRELNTIQNEMNRLFNTFFDAPASGGASPAASRRWLPAMDLVEAGSEFVLRADLPGVDESDVNIEVEDNVLSISGERKSEHEEHTDGYYRLERASGSFSRSLTLPDGVDPEKVQASFDKGVLEIRIPKPEQRQPRRVTISAGGGASQTLEGTETEGTKSTDSAGENSNASVGATA